MLGTSDVDAGDAFAYELVSGADSDDNAHFAIDGATLKAAESFNFEAKNSYKVRIRSTDFGGLATEQTFTIHVTDVNETPTSIGLSGYSLPENNASGDEVGLLSTIDVDAGDSFTYSLVSGPGSDDNVNFGIVGGWHCKRRSPSTSKGRIAIPSACEAPTAGDSSQSKPLRFI